MRRKRLSKIISIIVVISLLGISGCSERNSYSYEVQDSDVHNAEVNLTFYGFKYEPLNVQAIEKALYNYMNEHEEISISYESIKGVAYYDILNKRITTHNGDDIFMVDQATILEYKNKDILADLSDLSTIDDFSPLVKSQMDIDGELNYVPTSISAFGLYCNEDLLKAHNQKIPANWAEFKEVCDYFVQQGITPIVANNDISLKTVVIAKGMYSVYQSDNSKEEIEKFNSGEKDLAEALRPGFELVETMLQSGYINKEEAQHVEKTKDDLEIFAKGEQPFMLTGAWAAPRLRDLNPNFSFTIQPYPIMEDGCAMVINVDTRISVNANSPYLKEAKKFVEYLTQKDVMWDFVNSMSSFSPLEDERASEDAAIKSLSPYLTNGRSVLGADDNLDYPIWNLTRACIEKMLTGQSSDEAAAYLDGQIKQYREEAS